VAEIIPPTSVLDERRPPPPLGEALAGVEGWLTLDQAERLHAQAAALPSGAVLVEIGSFRGRSTIALALGAPDATVIAIDPHGGGDRGPREWDTDPARGVADRAAFEANLTRAGVEGRVRLLALRSDEALAHVPANIDLLYVDGSHRTAAAWRDVHHYGSRVRAGGHMLVHDAFSSVGVTAALVADTVARPGWRYCGRVGSLAHYERAVTSGRTRLAPLVELPWFLRNLAVKALIVARLGRFTRLLGHDSGDWPY